MISSMHNDLKQIILTSWKDRWSEKKWSAYIRKYLVHSSDVFHVADALVSQTFIGPSPNCLLLEYIWHALNTGLLSYGSVIIAISKHEDLHKIESTKAVYKLLEQLIDILNGSPIIEDGMDLCCSLRMILQWSLRNIEQYLKGMHDVYANVAEDLLRLNCYTLEQLTTKPRTSALLTIARFEESGVWSHIETDLAVIKNTSGQHSLHAEISASCHHVSQLSRCSISPKPSYPCSKTLSVCLPVSNLLMIEVETMKLTDHNGISQQLVLLSDVLGLDTAKLLFHCVQTCLMCYLDSVQHNGDYEPHWCAMLFLRMPKIIRSIKSAVVGSEFDSPSGSVGKKAAHFDLQVCEAINKLLAMDSLLDTLDQYGEDLNWMKILTDYFASTGLISEAAAQQIQKARDEQRENMSHELHKEKAVKPLMIIKAKSALEQLISAISSMDAMAEQERLLTTLQKLGTSYSFDIYMAAASASDQLSALASKLIMCNESVKSSTGETNKVAQVRASIFDISFLCVCKMVKIFGKAKILDASHQKAIEGTFLYQWIDNWCTPHLNYIQPKSMETDAARVDLLLQSLRNTTEFRPSLAKWQDMCTNLPQALLELLHAFQKGCIPKTELSRALVLIRDHCPLSVCAAAIAAVARKARLAEGCHGYDLALEMLSTKSEAHQQLTTSYDQRFVFFTDCIEMVAGDMLPEAKQKVKVPTIQTLQEAFSETAQCGWINHRRFTMFQDSLNYLGMVAFMRRIISLVLQETRPDSVTAAIDITFACMQFDMESAVVYLLKHGIPRYFMSEPMYLAPPVGKAFAKMTVAALDIALSDLILREKSLLAPHKISPFLHEASPRKPGDQGTRVRRLLSCSTEHDLSSAANVSGVPTNHPLFSVLEDFLQCLWQATKDHRWGPIPDFAAAFVKIALHSTPLVSRAVKQCLPTGMVRRLSSELVKESRELLFAASDLGNHDIRRLAAQAICQTDNIS